MKCIKCKKTIGNEDLYCGYCGINQKKFSIYIKKINEKIHIQRDHEYNKRVRNAKLKVEQLKQKRKNEIMRLTDKRWSTYSGINFSYSVREGKIRIDDKIFLFSDIKGAEITKENSCRYITNETSRSKKHVSLGKSIAGGALFGPVGAIAGGSMGKTTTTSRSYSDSIPTCNYLGVKVNLNNFYTDIVIFSNTINQSSSDYKRGLEIAQEIVETLRELSVIPVPRNYPKPEEEESVLKLNKEIKKAEKKLEEEKLNKPTYEIPKCYYE